MDRWTDVARRVSAPREDRPAWRRTGVTHSPTGLAADAHGSYRAPMAYREYTDAHRVGWRVWEVIPRSIERRRLRDRRLGARGVERRKRHEPGLTLSNGSVEGWLVFECPSEKRRLRPIPVGWFARSDDELAVMCERAERASRPTPRLIE
jgi:hypothetical protein